MKRIDTLADLKAEQKRLRLKKVMLEQEIEQNIADIKHDLSPVAIVGRGAKKALSSSKQGLVNTSISSTIDFVFKKVLLRNSNFLVRLAVPFIAKNLTKNYVHDNKTKILGWLGTLITSIGEKKHQDNGHNVYEKATADINL